MGKPSAVSKKGRRRVGKLTSLWQLVNKANEQDDPLAQFQAFKKFERSGLHVTLECKRYLELDAECSQWIFQLFERNMKTMYEQCQWGWNEKTKKEEMFHPMAWYLVARTADGTPVAYSHFRFDMDYGEPVLYCYELQLEEAVRRKGLGKFMLQILELLAFYSSMRKVVLTVIKDNTPAVSFFQSLKYTTDDTSPTL